MDAFWANYFDDLVGRFTGPMKFRLVMQPAMALFFAWRVGVADAKAGRTPFFWGLLTDPAGRRERLATAWKHLSRVFALAVVLDIVYQLIELGHIYVGQALTVAFVLAIIPFAVVTGLVTRFMRSRYLHSGHHGFGGHHSHVRG